MMSSAHAPVTMVTSGSDKSRDFNKNGRMRKLGDDENRGNREKSNCEEENRLLNVKTEDGKELQMQDKNNNAKDLNISVIEGTSNNSDTKAVVLSHNSDIRASNRSVGSCGPINSKASSSSSAVMVGLTDLISQQGLENPDHVGWLLDQNGRRSSWMWINS